MFVSKTTRLLGDIDRLQHNNKNVLVIKPRIDRRYDEEKVSSHNGKSIEAFAVSDAYEIISEHLDQNHDYTVIAVDEAFMIDNIDNVLINLFKSGYSIIVSSIQLDAEEKPFQSIKNMLPWATKIEICPAVCTLCDQDAYYTEALFDIKNATQEERIGSKNMYEPRCFNHYKHNFM